MSISFKIPHILTFSFDGYPCDTFRSIKTRYSKCVVCFVNILYLFLIVYFIHRNQYKNGQTNCRLLSVRVFRVAFAFQCSAPPGFRSSTDGSGGDADAVVSCDSSLLRISQQRNCCLFSHGGNRIDDTSERH